MEQQIVLGWEFILSPDIAMKMGGFVLVCQRPQERAAFLGEAKTVQSMRTLGPFIYSFMLGGLTVSCLVQGTGETQ